MPGKELITERDVAERAIGSPIVVGANVVITPAALDMAQQRGIPVVWTDDRGGGDAGTRAAGGPLPWGGADRVPELGPWRDASRVRSSSLPPAGPGTRWDVVPPASLGGPGGGAVPAAGSTPVTPCVPGAGCAGRCHAIRTAGTQPGTCSCPFAMLRQEGRYVVEVRGGVLRVFAQTPQGWRALS